MKDLLKWFEGLPKILKLIFALPGLDILWVVYRLCKSLNKGNNLGVILGVLLIIVGIPWLWLIDLVFILLDKPVLWLD